MIHVDICVGQVEGDEECLVLARTTLPTVGGVEDAVRGKITTRDEIEEKVDKREEKLYFLSSTGRFICSTDWAQVNIESSIKIITICC